MSGFQRQADSLFSGHVDKLIDIRNIAISAGVDILPRNQSATYKPISFFMVYTVFEAAGSLVIRRTFTDLGNVTKSEVLNEGYPFADNAAYIFAFPVSPNETINFQYSANTTCTKLTLLESQVM